jgi:hypothetical protein
VPVRTANGALEGLLSVFLGLTLDLPSGFGELVVELFHDMKTVGLNLGLWKNGAAQRNGKGAKYP